MTDFRVQAIKAAKLSAHCAETALRFASQLLTKLADAVHRHAQA